MRAEAAKRTQPKAVGGALRRKVGMSDTVERRKRRKLKVVRRRLGKEDELLR